jgi:hypothetical protein
MGIEVKVKSYGTPTNEGGVSGQSLFDQMHQGESGQATSDVPQAITGAGLAQAIQSAPKEEGMSWWDVPVKAYANIIPSAQKFGQGLVEAAQHPVESAKGLMDIAAGTLRNVTPKHIADWIDKADKNPEAATHASSVADMVGSFYKDRYGSSEGFKNALAYDPVGVMSDLSAVLSGGSSLVGTAESALGKAGTVSKALETAGAYTNPITAPLSVAGKAGKVILGGATGTGTEAISGAAKAGAQGDQVFQEHLRGLAPMTDALDNAKYNLGLMRQAKNDAYRSGMIDISNDATQLKFDDVDKALGTLKNAASYKGQITNPTGYKLYEHLSDMVNDWKNLPADEYHTPEGFDALKQKIGDAVESIPYEQAKARTMGNKVYNSVKQTINDQAKTYSDVMSDYAEASDQIDQIEKGLSLGNKASVDTAMRKLQSLTRNNVNTNYGSRLSLAQQLEAQPGAKPFLNALYGQALSSPTARGMAGTIESGSALAGLTNPAYWATLPLQTPRLVGEGLYYGGRAAQGLQDRANMIGLTAPRANALADLLNVQNRIQGQ